MHNGTPVLDIHAHVSAPMHGTPNLALMLAANSDLGADPLAKNAMNFGMDDEAWADSVGKHVALIDQYGIDAQLLGPRPFLMLGWMSAHLLEPWARFVNNMIARQVMLAPTRFVGAAQLPQNAKAEDLTHCIPELDRCVKELGFKAVYLSPDPAGDRSAPGLHKPYWYPVYERCQEYGIPIIIHGTNCKDERLDCIPHNYQISFVWEQYLATQIYRHSDVFDKFPELKVVVCHCGGALDRFLKEDVAHMGKRDVSRNLFFDTNAPDLHCLEAAIKQRTPAQICFGTEAPGSGRAPRADTGRPGDDLVPIIDGFDFLSAQDKKLIFHDNCARVCPGLGALGNASA